MPIMTPIPRLRQKPGIFLGANDGASGAALFCEMAETMKKLPCKYGVDFVLFDGEELIFDKDATGPLFSRLQSILPAQY